jgi:hypothetical protein
MSEKEIKEDESWYLWLEQRIPHLKETGAYKFWIKIALNGYKFGPVIHKETTISETLKELEQQVSDLTKERGWISIEDRLPETRDQVIAYFPRGNEGGEKVATGIRSQNQIISDFPNSTAHCFKASHWMPLPSPPKE